MAGGGEIKGRVLRFEESLVVVEQDGHERTLFGESITGFEILSRGVADTPERPSTNLPGVAHSTSPPPTAPSEAADAAPADSGRTREPSAQSTDTPSTTPTMAEEGDARLTRISPEPAPGREGSPRTTGRITWFDRRGFGFIQSHEGKEIYFHINEVSDSKLRRALDGPNGALQTQVGFEERPAFGQKFQSGCRCSTDPSSSRDTGQATPRSVAGNRSCEGTSPRATASNSPESGRQRRVHPVADGTWERESPRQNLHRQNRFFWKPRFWVH